MSDIPPELIDEPKPAPKPSCFQNAWSSVLWWWVALTAALCFGVIVTSPAQAATFDPSNTYCELFQLDSSNGRYYIAADPPWTPSCPHPWVTVPVAKFQALVDAYEAAEPASGPASGQFTSDEVAKLKTQAQVGLTMHIEPKPMDPEFISDMSLLTGAAMVALAAIFCGRRLLSFFTFSPRD